MFRRRSKVISLQVDLDNCTGCGNCVIRCKRNVFTLMRDRDAFFAVALSYDKCKGCGHCLEVCPQKAIKIIKEK